MNTRISAARRAAAGILAALSLLLLPGCTSPGAKDRAPVQPLTCTRPAALSGITPAGGAAAAVCWAFYETNVTTVQVVDTASDTVKNEITLDGVWALKEQAFADHRLALCDRENGMWRFFSSSLTELGTMQADSMEGFFSYEGDTYYYISDHVLCAQDVSGGTVRRVPLTLELRLLDIMAFDAAGSRMVVQFFLSPYGSECGTAVLDPATGQISMLRQERYQAAFTGGDGLCLLSFDADRMGYSALYGSDSRFFFADAGLFQDIGGDLYAVSGAPYLMGVSDGSALYALGEQLRVCALPDCGVDGQMFSVCWLPDAAVLLGGVYRDSAFQLYVMDPARLPFTEVPGTASADAPLTVDDTLAQAYWNTSDSAPVAESLQEARQYADTLESRYGIRVLLSDQCRDAAALCDRDITLTDTMTADEELAAVNTALDALARTLSLYPDGFTAQFRNGMGEGGVRFLLVSAIASDYGVVGVTYESADWQNIALDIRMSDSLDSLICHELWHATENRILSHDYAAIDPDSWDALNPPGFTYCGDAALSNDLRQWTLYSCDPEDVCFVDGYACVDAREDRARIMEYFMVHEDAAQLLIESPVIRQKLQIMCAAVRNNFDTAGWGQVRWEALL